MMIICFLSKSSVLRRKKGEIPFIPLFMFSLQIISSQNRDGRDSMHCPIHYLCNIEVPLAFLFLKFSMLTNNVLSQRFPNHWFLETCKMTFSFCRELSSLFLCDLRKLTYPLGAIFPPIKTMINLNYRTLKHTFYNYWNTVNNEI